MSQKAAMRQRRRAVMGCKDVAKSQRKWTKIAPTRTAIKVNKK